MRRERRCDNGLPGEDGCQGDVLEIMQCNDDVSDLIEYIYEKNRVY